MTYTNVWNEASPSGQAARDLVDNFIRQQKLDFRERIEDSLVDDWSADPVALNPGVFTGLGDAVLTEVGGAAAARTATFDLNLGNVFDCGTIAFVGPSTPTFTFTFTNRQVGYARIVYVTYKMQPLPGNYITHRINTPDTDWALFPEVGWFSGAPSIPDSNVFQGLSDDASTNGKVHIPIMILGS